MITMVFKSNIWNGTIIIRYSNGRNDDFSNLYEHALDLGKRKLEV